jgi:hypothetical protein
MKFVNLIALSCNKTGIEVLVFGPGLEVSLNRKESRGAAFWENTRETGER